MPRKAAPRAPAPRPSIPSVIGDDEIVMHRSSLATAAIASDDDFDITQLDDIPTATGPTGRSKSSKRKVNAVSGRAASKKAETSDPSFAANRSKAVGSSRRKPVASTVESSQSPTLPPTSSVSGSEEGKARRSRVARAGDAFPPSVTDEEAVNMVWRGALTEIQAPQPEAVVLKPAKPLPRASQPSALNATAPESSGDEDASYMRQNTSASKRKRTSGPRTSGGAGRRRASAAAPTDSGSKKPLKGKGASKEPQSWLEDPWVRHLKERFQAVDDKTFSDGDDGVEL